MSSELSSEGRISAFMVLSGLGIDTLWSVIDPLAEGVREMFCEICSEK